ncbi:MAG: translation initiation factor IF-2 subunit alpha [Thermoplasmata archaeon]
MVKLSPYPEEGELVVCTVKEVKSFGAFVELNEYKGKEGFIHIAEVATGWVKYIRDHVREGQKVVCKVLRVDPSKQHIDLSLKQVNDHQRKEKIQEWKNEQRAEKLFELVAQALKKPVEACYEEFGRALVERFGSLYAVFEECAVDQRALEKEGFKGPWVKALVRVAQENIVPPRVEIHGQFELVWEGPDGVKKIKEALMLAEGSHGGGEVTIQYLGAPRYRITVSALDYRTAEESLKGAVERVLEHVKKCGGRASFTRERGGSCAHT